MEHTGQIVEFGVSLRRSSSVQAFDMKHNDKTASEKKNGQPTMPFEDALRKILRAPPAPKAKSKKKKREAST